MIDANEQVILVSENDEAVGNAPKLDVHYSGRLHRAFSVFVLDASGRVLFQRRAAGKYHSPRLWSNTCCGHPRPGERTREAAARRLQEEMGITCELTHLASFIYRAPLAGELVEHELDHVYVGISTDIPEPDPAEVEEWRWIELPEAEAWLARDPRAFTAWFPHVFGKLLVSGQS